MSLYQVACVACKRKKSAALEETLCSYRYCEDLREGTHSYVERTQYLSQLVRSCTVKGSEAVVAACHSGFTEHLAVYDAYSEDCTIPYSEEK